MLSDNEIQAIIERVRGRVAAAEISGRAAPVLRAADDLAVSEVELGDGIHPDIDAAVTAARNAFIGYREMGLEARKTIVEAMRAAMLREGERLGYMAAEETGLGRGEDKAIKNRLVTTRTPGPEDLEPQVVTGDSGMMVTEFAPLRRHRIHHPHHQPDVHDHQQFHRDRLGRQRRHLQCPSQRPDGLRRERPAAQPRHRWRRWSP